MSDKYIKLADNANVIPSHYEVACNRFATGTLMVEAKNCSTCQYHDGIVEIGQPVYLDGKIVDAVDTMVKADELSFEYIAEIKRRRIYQILCNRPKRLPLTIAGSIDQG